MSVLAQQKCVPCEGGVKPLARDEFAPYLAELKDWQVIQDKKVQKDFKFKDFQTALDFINKVGALSEEENHHPDIFLHNYKRVQIILSTHAIDGLSVNDFILAAKIDKIGQI